MRGEARGSLLAAPAETACSRECMRSCMSCMQSVHMHACMQTCRHARMGSCSGKEPRMLPSADHACTRRGSAAARRQLLRGSPAQRARERLRRVLVLGHEGVGVVLHQRNLLHVDPVVAGGKGCAQGEEGALSALRRQAYRHMHAPQRCSQQPAAAHQRQCNSGGSGRGAHFWGLMRDRTTQMMPERQIATRLPASMG